jgi:hypothetical protein
MNKQTAERFRPMNYYEHEHLTSDCLAHSLTAHQQDILHNHICGHRAGQQDAHAKLISHFLKWPHQFDAAINIFTKYTNKQ